LGDEACDLSLILIQTVPCGFEGVNLFEETKIIDIRICTFLKE
jgi:hypothetical protein